MRKVAILTVISLVVIVGAGAVWAQADETAPGTVDEAPAGGFRGNRPEDAPCLPELNLTEDQREALQRLNEQMREKRGKMLEEREDLRTAYREALRQGDGQEAANIRQQMVEGYRERLQLEEQRIRELKEILNEDQLAQFCEWAPNRRQRGGPPLQGRGRFEEVPGGRGRKGR